MRICSVHKSEQVQVQQCLEVKGKAVTFNFKFEDIPAGIGVQTFPDIESNRSIMARQRRILREWEKHGDDLKRKFGQTVAEEVLEMKKMNVALLEVEKEGSNGTYEKSTVPIQLLKSCWCDAP